MKTVALRLYFRYGCHHANLLWRLARAMWRLYWLSTESRRCLLRTVLETEKSPLISDHELAKKVFPTEVDYVRPPEELIQSLREAGIIEHAMPFVKPANPRVQDGLGRCLARMRLVPLSRQLHNLELVRRNTALRRGEDYATVIELLDFLSQHHASLPNGGKIYAIGAEGAEISYLFHTKSGHFNFFAVSTYFLPESAWLLVMEKPEPVPSR